MTEEDDSIMYHAQSFTEEPEKENASDFSNADAQSQEQRRPASTASPNVCAPTPTTETTSGRPADPPATPFHNGFRRPAGAVHASGKR